MSKAEKLFRQADESYFRGNYGKAMPLFIDLIKAYPNTCGAYVRIASIFAKQGKYQEAFDILGKGLNIHPNDYGLNYEMGQIHFMVGDDEKALRYLHKAIMINPKEDVAILRIIHVCTKTREWTLLRNVLEYAIEHHQQNVDFLYTYGACLMQSFADEDPDSKQKSIMILQRAYSLGSRKRELLFYLGAAYEILGEKEISGKYFTELEKISNGNRTLELLF